MSVQQVKVHGSASNNNPCISKTVAADGSLIGDPTKSVVGVTLSTDAFPQPHKGDPITLSNTKVTVHVPGDLLVLGYNIGILTPGQKITATLSLQILGSNTTEGSLTYPLLHSNPTVIIHDPDGAKNTGDETADPLTVTDSLPDSTWHPTSPTKDVFFTQGAAVIKAFVDFFGTPVTATVTCSVTKPASFVAVAAESATPPSTTGTTPVTVAAVTTTTKAATGTGSGSLPRTGASVVFWLVVGAVLIDAGVVAILSTRRRARYLFHRHG